MQLDKLQGKGIFSKMDIVMDAVHDIKYYKFQVKSPISKPCDKTSTWSWETRGMC